MPPKLSELIRRGAKMRSQSYGELFESVVGDNGERSYKSCAIGAACEAAGFGPDVDLMDIVKMYRLDVVLGYGLFDTPLPDKLRNYVTPDGDPFSGENNVGYFIQWANDDLAMRREKIADIVEEAGL